jgi:hypothetical protein
MYRFPFIRLARENAKVLSQNRRSLSSIPGDLMSTLATPFPHLQVPQRLPPGARRDIAITLVSRIWAPALLIFGSVSKAGERNPRFVKPLGAASILAASTTAAWRSNLLRLTHEIEQADREGTHDRRWRSRPDSHNSYYGTNKPTTMISSLALWLCGAWPLRIGGVGH